MRRFIRPAAIFCIGAAAVCAIFAARITAGGNVAISIHRNPTLPYKAIGTWRPLCSV